MKYLKYLFLLITFVIISSFCHSSKEINVSNTNNKNGFLVSSYIRGNFYNRGQISASQLNACTDIICIGAAPGADGSLIFESFKLYNGEGASSLEQLISSIRNELTGGTTLRLGIHGGENWKTMIANDAAVKNFVRNIKKTLSELQLNGVDLDFEWAENDIEYSNYSRAIVALSEIIEGDQIFSITLNPISYKISENAIDAVTYISLQCYGPSPFRFSYDNFISSIQKVINYGIPARKLVPGIPFYGVTADESKQSIAYRELVKNNLITSAAINEVEYDDENYVFNGIDVVKKKTSYSVSQGFYGVMSWSLGTDTDYSNKWSLLKAINNSLE